MKKLTLACAALAASFAFAEGQSLLWSEYEDFTGFPVSDNTPTIPLATPVEGGYTGNLTDAMWFTTASSQDSTLQTDSTRGNYLHIDASDGELIACVNAPAADETIGESGGFTLTPVNVGEDEAGDDASTVYGGVFVDTMVQFTASEAAPDIDAEDKIIVWYANADTVIDDIVSIDGDVVTTEPRTLTAGLKVTAMRSFGGEEGGDYYPYVYDINTSVDLTAGWHRLTIKSLTLGDIVDGTMPGQIFRIYLDGSATPLVAVQPHNFVGEHITDKTLFLSLKYDNEYQNISSVAFRGQGDIDDFVFADSDTVDADNKGSAFPEGELAVTYLTINGGDATGLTGYTLTYTSNEEEIAAGEDGYEVVQGAGVTLTLELESNYTATVTLDDEEIESGNGTVFEFTAPIAATGTIAITLEQQAAPTYYTVVGATATGANIAITDDGAAYDSTTGFEAGSTIGITVTAAEGYRVTSVTVNGNTATVGQTYTVADANSNITIVVEAVPLRTITATADDNSTVTWTINGTASQETEVVDGDAVVFTFGVADADTYELDTVTVNGATVSGTTYTATIAGDIAVNVTAKTKQTGTTYTDASGNTITIDATTVTALEELGITDLTAKPEGSDLTYGQAYALGLLDMDNGTVSEIATPAITVNTDGTVTVALSGLAPNAAVTCTLQYKTALAATEWNDAATAPYDEGATLSNTPESTDSARFYRVKITFTDAE